MYSRSLVSQVCARSRGRSGERTRSDPLFDLAEVERAALVRVERVELLAERLLLVLELQRVPVLAALEPEVQVLVARDLPVAVHVVLLAHVLHLQPRHVIEVVRVDDRRELAEAELPVLVRVRRLELGLLLIHLLLK